MKRIIPLLIVAFSMNCLAEELPQGYYDGANGKKDKELKTALHEIIKGGERFQYGPNTYHTSDANGEKGSLKAIGTWGAFNLTDKRTDGSVYDMYGNTMRYFPPKGQSGAGLDIEHCFPKSWWGGDNNDAYKDLYHLNPADMYANGNKSNYPPGYVPSADKFDNGSFRMGKNSEYGDFLVFEPADQYKGDFARAYFYIATAYEDFEWKADFSKYIVNDDYLEFKPWLVNVLLDWHRKDPVSEKEINRLDAISSLQHNRNPYIDFPELVEYIWGNKKGEDVDFSTLVATFSDEYKCPIEKENPTAYEATDITATGFSAHWKDVDAGSYRLEVFTKAEKGHNDTLLNVPLVKSDSIKNNPYIRWTKSDGTDATYNNTDGGGAFYMSTTTEKRFFKISGLSIGENAKLVVKCSVWNKGDQTATLVVTADGEVLDEIELNLNEEYHTIPLKSGTKEITLAQAEIGSKGNYHRISMQQIFVIQGDYELEETIFDGYPEDTRDTDAEVKIDLEDGQTVYYRVTPSGMVASNTVAVTYNATPVDPQPDPEPEDALYNSKAGYEVFTEGLNVKIMGTENGINIQAYDIMGRKVAESISSEETNLTMPQQGIYIICIGNNKIKIII